MTKASTAKAKSLGAKLKEKILGAARAGITNIVIPRDNEADLEDLSEAARSKIETFPVTTLAEALATTLRGMDLFAGHPWNIGIFGNLASLAAQDVIARADCVVFFGAGLNQRTTDRNGLTAGKAVISIDLDRSAISRRPSRFAAPTNVCPASSV